MDIEQECVETGMPPGGSGSIAALQSYREQEVPKSLPGNSTMLPSLEVTDEIENPSESEEHPGRNGEQSDAELRSRIRRLISGPGDGQGNGVFLGSNRFMERECARTALVREGLNAVPLVVEALRNPSPEIARRAQLILSSVVRNLADEQLLQLRDITFLQSTLGRQLTKPEAAAIGAAFNREFTVRVQQSPLHRDMLTYMHGACEGDLAAIVAGFDELDTQPGRVRLNQQVARLLRFSNSPLVSNSEREGIAAHIRNLSWLMSPVAVHRARMVGRQEVAESMRNRPEAQPYVLESLRACQADDERMQVARTVCLLDLDRNPQFMQSFLAGGGLAEHVQSARDQFQGEEAERRRIEEGRRR
jgi:hypothetical protein